MRILIIGAGVVGSTIAAYLAEAGEDVKLLARGQRLKELRGHGVILRDFKTGEEKAVDVDVVERLKPSDAYDWVFVVVRCNQVSSVLPMLAKNEQTPNVAFLGNNAGGPGPLVQALGRDRVLMGFGGVGGVREDHAIRTFVGREDMEPTIVIGELDGRTSPRLKRLSRVVERAGFDLDVSDDIDAYLKAHAALVLPLAEAIYLADGDNYRLARTRDGLVLIVRAAREGFRVLRALDISIRPPGMGWVVELPEPLLVAILRRVMDTEFAEIAIAGHANAARDEFRCLANQFGALVQKASIPTPSMDILEAYIDPEAPVPEEGSERIPLNWRRVWIALGGLAAMAGTIAGLLFWWFRRRDGGEDE